MATYTVTTSNWNSAAFWSGISEAGAGHTLDFSALGSGYTTMVNEGTGEITISDGSTIFVIGDSGASGGPYDATLGGSTLVEYFDQVVGTSGNDTVSAGSGDESIMSGDGDDWVIDGPGNDTVDTGAGNDRVNIGSGNDSIQTGDGDDTIFVSDGDDIDTIDGGSGGTDRDTLNFVFSTGATVTFDGTGSGTYADVGATASGQFSEIEILDLTDAADSVDASLDAGGMAINADAGDDTILGGTGSDTIFGGDGNDNIALGGGADQAAGGAGVDTVTGIDGDDFVNFGAGDDSGSATGGNNTLIGGEGADTLTSDAGADSLSGGVGADVITAGGGADTIDGGSGADNIDAGDGDDLVAGGSGLDTISGGAGNDTLYGDEADLGSHAGTLTNFNFDTISVTGDAGTGAIGQYAIYDNIGTTDQGVVIQAKMTIIDADDPDMDVTFGTNSVYLNADGQAASGSGVTVTFEFYDQATGLPVQIDGAFTFQDIDTSAESVSAESSDVSSVAVSASPATSLTITDTGEQLTASSDATSSGAADENHWAQFAYDSQQELVFVLTTRGVGTNYAFSDSSFTNPPTVIGSTPEAQDDSIDGGTGDDLIYGLAGNDTINGEDGADTINGGTGDDVLSGGADEDVFIVQDGFGSDSVTGGETTTTGTDFDTLDLSALTAGANVVYDGLMGPEAGTATDGTDTLSFYEIERLVLTDQNDTVDGSTTGTEMVVEAGAGDDSVETGGNKDVIDGGAGNDTLRGGFGEDTITGGAGNDSIHGNEDADSLMGGDGSDSLYGELGADYVDGGAGDDTVEGNEGDDTLVGGDGNDWMRGSFDNDILYGGAGDDYLWGGWGDDTFVIENGFGNDTVDAEGVDETTGDVLDLSAVTDDLTVDLSNADPEIGTVSDGTSTLNFNEIETVVLGGGRDTLVMADAGGADVVEAFDMTDSGDGTTNDQLDVSGLTSDGGTTPVTVADAVVSDDGFGNAVLTFPGGESITLKGVTPAQLSTPAALESIGIPAAPSVGPVDGTAGADTMSVGFTDAQGDIIDGVDGDDDTIYGYGGDDSIDGGAGADTIDGGAGNDTLYGDAGDDSVLGGDGDDTLAVEFTLDNDTLVGGEGAETSGDLIDLAGIADDLTVTHSGPEAGTITDGTSTTEFSEIESFQLGSGNDSYVGGTGSDTVWGHTGDDTLEGNGGADLLQGAAGNDSILGGAGDDTLYGWEDSDTIDGGTGADLIGGNDGDDSIRLSDGFGNDTIVGGETAETNGDTLDLSGLTVDTSVDLTDANAETGTVSDGTDTAQFTEIENITLGGGRDTILLADGSGSDTVGAFDLTDSGDGTANDQLDVSALTSDGGTTPVTTDDVTVTDDGSGNAVLTFVGGESITLLGVAPAALATPAQLAAIGIPQPSTDVPDNFMLLTDVTWDGSGQIIDQLAGQTIDVNGNATGGAFVAETTTATFHDTDGDGLLEDNDLGTPESITVDDSASLTGSTSAVLTTSGITGYTITLIDGTTLTEADLGELPIRVLADNTVVIDFDDTQLATYLSGANEIESITFGAGATQNDAYSGFFTAPFENSYVPLDNIVEGTAGADLIDATYVGDPEGDVIDGNDHSDGSNNDSIEAGAGDDTILAGDGDDTIALADGFGNDSITGGETGETDGDTLDLSGLTTDTTVDLSDANPETGTVSDGTDTANFFEIENVVLGGGRDTVLLADGSGSDTVTAFDMTDSGDGSTNDQLDVSALTSDGGTTAVTTDDVTVTDDGSGNAVLTFVGGEAITLMGVDPALLATPAALASIGIPIPASGNFIVEGTAGADVINTSYAGDPEGDVIDGFDHSDGSNDDSVVAGAGDDSIDAGLGDDTILAGDGDDEIFIDVSLDNDSIVGGEGGETQGDRINFSTVADDITITFSGAETGALTDGVNTTTFEEIERFQMGTGNDSVIGSDGAEHIIGNFGDDTILGGGGDDTIFSGFDNDSVSGGDGNDSLVTSTGADTVDGGAGDDDIDLGIGDGETDLVVMGDGDGNDTVSGFEAPTDLGGGVFAGNDQLDVTGLTDLAGNPVSTEDVTVTDTVGDGSGDAILTFPNGESITLVGVLPAEVADPAQLEAMGIPAFTGNLIVEGTAAGDLIDGAYLGDPDGDLVDNGDGVGGSNADSITAGGGDDTVLGADGDDTIRGEAGDDSLSGGAGDDSLLGGDGQDTLTSDAGADTLDGGADEDTIVLTDGFGADSIEGGETVTTGTDTDTLDTSGLTGPVTVTFSGDEAGTVTDGTDSATFGGIEVIQLTEGTDSLDGSASTSGLTVFGGGGGDTITGGIGDDTISGDDSTDSIFGGLGNDSLLGGTSSDTLDGGDGDDTLEGGSEGDSLTGGAGADSLIGGTGDDTLNVGSGDTASGEDGDDTFFANAADMNGGSLTITGGETGETAGDTLNITGPATIAMSGAEAGTVTWLDGSVLTFSEIENINYTPCFTPGTLIKTAVGEKDAADIAVGDIVLTRDNGYQTVRWAGSKRLSALQLDANAALQPIRIKAGALGAGMPDRDMVVSPQHRVLMSSASIQLLFGEEEVLVAATHIVGRPGIERMCPDDGVTYVHFMFDRHELVMSDGIWTESFQPGDLSLAGLDQDQREELLTLFPDLARAPGQDQYASARMSLKAFQARLLTEA